MKITLNKILLDSYEFNRRTPLASEYAWKALFRIEIIDAQKNEIIPEYFYFIVMSSNHKSKSDATLIQDGQLDVSEVVKVVESRLNKVHPENVDQFFNQMSEQFVYSD